MSIPIRVRENFLEPRIENDICYFGSRNYFKDMFIENLRKELRKNDEIMKKLEEQKKA